MSASPEEIVNIPLTSPGLNEYALIAAATVTSLGLAAAMARVVLTALVHALGAAVRRESNG